MSAQNEYNLLDRAAEAELVPACLHFGLGLLPFYPLASGLLTGKYQRGAPPPAGTRMAEDRYAGRFARAPWDTIEGLEKYAGERGVSMLDVAIGGLAARPSVASVIAGARTAEQVRANAPGRRVAAVGGGSRGARRDRLTGSHVQCDRVRLGPSVPC